MDPRGDTCYKLSRGLWTQQDSHMCVLVTGLPGAPGAISTTGREAGPGLLVSGAAESYPGPEKSAGPALVPCAQPDRLSRPAITGKRLLSAKRRAFGKC